MHFTRSHYQTCLEADLLTDSSRLRSSKHDSSASVTLFFFVVGGGGGGGWGVI